MTDLIITHPGSAHFDEFFAVSLILSSFSDRQFTIERREPTPAELANPDIWVVDIGMHHEPSKKNFDHHQDMNSSASFVLVADYLNLTPVLRLMPWWVFKDRIDRFGPAKIGAEIGTDKLRITYSPFESFFLKQFSDAPMNVLDIMKAFGTSVIYDARHMANKLAFWEQCPIKTVKGHTIIIGETNEADGAELYNEKTGNQLSVSVTHDSRGDGWKLCRFDNAQDIDFSKLQSDKRIKFAHKTGFVAKTYDRLPIEAVMTLIQRAIP